jgi:hypothetical protein
MPKHFFGVKIRTHSAGINIIIPKTSTIIHVEPPTGLRL